MSFSIKAQISIQGKVFNTQGASVPFAVIDVCNSMESVVADEYGVFTIEITINDGSLEVKAPEYQTQVFKIAEIFNPLVVFLKPKEVIQQEIPSTALQTVVVKAGKRIKKKNNPAVVIIEQLIKNKKQFSSLKLGQLNYDKYEKVQFNVNNVDAALMQQPLFKDLNFVFDRVDTTANNGKKYLPIYFNEAVYKGYTSGIKKREDLVGNQSTSVGKGVGMTHYLKNLYVDYNVYEDYIQVFRKSFVSPLSTIGLNTYNYLLADSIVVGGKKKYKIIFYPIRSNELTFRGSVWIADGVFKVQQIDLKATKSANLNWVKELRLSQAFDIEKDSVPLKIKDLMTAEFSINKKNTSIGLVGKRTTLYANYNLDKDHLADFYNIQSDIYQDSIYTRDSEFWEKHRIEKLSNQEAGVYEMMNQLKQHGTFKKIYQTGIVLASGYIEYPNFDFGPIGNMFGYNQIEGLRLTLGGRTYFGINDLWRLQGYAAFGLKDLKAKYALSYKQMLHQKSRLIVGIGRRDDVQQLGGGLTQQNTVLNKDGVNASLFVTGNTTRMAKVVYNNAYVSVAPKQNGVFTIGVNQKQIQGVSNQFKMSFIDKNGRYQTVTNQTELYGSMLFTPHRKLFGKGVEPKEVSDQYTTYYLGYTKGIKNLMASDFEYDQIQLQYKKPLYLGVLGRSLVNAEVGKIFGDVSIGLLSAAPANQSIVNNTNTFGLLNFYEFVMDRYASARFEHHFNGLVLGKVPYIKKFKLREIVGVHTLYGNITQSNINKNLPSLNSLPFTSIQKQFIAPNRPYVEYHAAIANIFKIARIDFYWRGNYFENDNAQKFGIKGSFNFTF